MKNTLWVLRAEKSLSQSDLAQLAGVSRQMIHAIEAQKYDPSLPLAFKLAEIYNLQIEEIFDPEDQAHR